MGHNPDPNVPDLPEGFAMALLKESDARICYESLSDVQNASVINYIQNNNMSGDEAKNKVNNCIENLKSNSLDFI